MKFELSYFRAAGVGLGLLIMATIVQRPIAAAVQHVSEKTPVGSALRSAEWAQMPLSLRQQAQFSAGVESARVLNRVQSGVLEILSHSRNEFGVLTDRSKLIADITRLAEAEGLAPADPSLKGTVQDITSERRAELIYEQQTGQAYGRANWKADMDEDILNAAPAWELVRVESRKIPRDWIQRWRAAGGRFFQGNRMIALKTDAVWERLSRFGTPWPPFDFGSGMGVEDVLRPECIELGLISLGTRVAPKEFEPQLEASVRNLSPELKNVLKEHFGEQVELDGELVKWKGGVELHEQAAANRRESAGRIFAGSASALGPVQPANDATEEVRSVVRRQAVVNSVEISAVAAGRKPLFHEDLRYLNAAQVEDYRSALQKQLPQGIIARFQGGHLYVYNPDLVGRLADPKQPLWPQVLANRDNGRWLGYGANWHETSNFSTVLIEDFNGEVIAGFGAPPDTAALYGAARAQDWSQATGGKYTYSVLRRGGAA